MRVPVEPDVDALYCVPQLIERRIEVEVDAARNAIAERRLPQHARDVDQQFGVRGGAAQLGVWQAHGFARVLPQQRRAALQTEARDDVLEVAGVDRRSERRGRRLNGSGCDRLDEKHVVSQLPQTRARTAGRPTWRRPVQDRPRSFR